MDRALLRLNMLLEATAAWGRSASLTALLPELPRIKWVLEFDACAVLIRGTAHTEGRAFAVTPLDARDVAVTALSPPVASALRRALDDGQPLIEREATQHRLAYPLESGSRFVGAVCFSAATAYDYSDLRFAQFIAQALAGIVDRVMAREDEHCVGVSEARYRSLVSVVTDVPWSADPTGAFVTPQPAWGAFTGQSPSDMAGFGWLDAIHPDDRDSVRAAWARARDSRTVYESHGRLWHASSRQYRYFVARAAPVLDSDDGAREWVGACTDVHERTCAETALRESESYFRDLAQKMPQGVWTNLPDGRIDWANTQWLVCTGQTLDGIQNDARAWMTALHPDDRETATAAFTDGTQSGAGFEVEARFRSTSAAPYRWYLHRSVALRDRAGNIVKFLGTSTDIDDLKQAESAARDGERRLQDADRRKDEFLATLAHELRNPLAPIRTGLQLIRLAGDTQASVERIRGMMERQIGHMTRLIDDLLDVSRITSGRIHLQRRPASLAEMVHGAVEANRTFIEAGGLELAVQLPDRDCRLDVDATRFVQIVSNLLHNAAKFTEPGGRIGVSADVVDAGDTRELRLAVTDTGIGIAPEMLPRVFELFTQGQQSTNRSHGGLGIGLALTQQLVELHGGRIEARSEGEGRGSEFLIRLPLSAVAASEPAEAAPPNEPHPIRRRVVIVDDNADAAEMLARLVETLGGDAYTASDGATGLRRVAEHAPDIVFLDIGMPGMDGYETCRRIRELPPRRPVLIVALTGWGQAQDKQRAADAGFDAHLTKPADPATIERLLAGSAGSAVPR